MRIESIIFSLLLHGSVLALMLFWPGEPPVDLQRQSYQVSLVMGAPGGEELPSPVLGARPEKTSDSQPERGAALPDMQPDATPELPALPETPPAPDAQPNLPVPVEIPDRTPAAVPVAPEPEAPKPEKEPEPKEIPPEKIPEAAASEKEEPKKETPKEEPKKESKKEEPKKEEPKEEPKKETPKPAAPPKEQKKPDKPRRSALDDALADVRRETRSSSGTSSSSSSSASRALEELARETGSGGVGGGGGSGTGPGGGGIYDVYVAQVILAVQPNWSMPTYSRENLMVGVRIKLAPDGKVLDCRIEQSSGRPDFDASAINAVLRTKNLPPPPTPAQQDLLISFNAQQLAGR